MYLIEFRMCVIEGNRSRVVVSHQIFFSEKRKKKPPMKFVCNWVWFRSQWKLRILHNFKNILIIFFYKSNIFSLLMWQPFIIRNEEYRLLLLNFLFFQNDACKETVHLRLCFCSFRNKIVLFHDSETLSSALH